MWGCTGTGRRVWRGAGGPKVARSVPCRVGRASAKRLKPFLGRARDQCGVRHSSWAFWMAPIDVLTRSIVDLVRSDRLKITKPTLTTVTSTATGDVYTRSPPSPRYSTASTYRATLLISHINQLWNAECSHTALDLNTRQHGHIWPRAARPRDQYRVPPPIANCSQRTTQSESQVSVPAHPFQCARERSRRGSSKCSQPKMLPKRPVRAHGAHRCSTTVGASLQHSS